MSTSTRQLTELLTDLRTAYRDAQQVLVVQERIASVAAAQAHYEAVNAVQTRVERLLDEVGEWEAPRPVHGSDLHALPYWQTVGDDFAAQRALWQQVQRGEQHLRAMDAKLNGRCLSCQDYIGED